MRFWQRRAGATHSAVESIKPAEEFFEARRHGPATLEEMPVGKVERGHEPDIEDRAAGVVSASRISTGLLIVWVVGAGGLEPPTSCV